MTIDDLPIGGRLLIRSRLDWRVAVVSRKTDDGITLSVASPKGRNYRLRREPGHAVRLERGVPFLATNETEKWTDNFAVYDRRW